MLDRQAVAVRWFGPGGDYLGGITSRGAGPGELRSPRTITITPNLRLGILDSGNGRISTYRANGTDLEYENTIPVVTSPYASYRQNLCAIADGWFLYQQDQDNAVREYDSAGNKVRSFQPARRFDEEVSVALASFAELAVNSGMLLCVPDQSMVVSVGTRSDTVRAYSAGDASLLWVQPLTGIVPEQYEFDDMPGFPTESDAAHVGVSVVRWDDESFLVQYRYWSGERSEPDVARMESIQMSIPTGDVIARSERLPVVEDIRGSILYTYEADPYPRVILWRRGQ